MYTHKHDLTWNSNRGQVLGRIFNYDEFKWVPHKKNELESYFKRGDVVVIFFDPTAAALQTGNITYATLGLTR